MHELQVPQVSLDAEPAQAHHNAKPRRAGCDSSDARDAGRWRRV
jgi:hypothetical protein